MNGGKGIPHPSVFITYRRADVGSLADEIADSIRRLFGEESVFIDTGDIPAGSRWAEVLDRHLEGMAALLCIIGPEWIGAAAGRRRIDDPTDWVRRELRSAIDRQVPILPILANRAHLVESELPADLRPLLEVQAIEATPSTPGFQAVIDWLAQRLVPPIRFIGPLAIDQGSLAAAYEACRYRLGPASLVFQPSSPKEALAQVASDRRACLIRQPVAWHSDLVARVDRPKVPDHVRRTATGLLRGVERRLTSMWLGLVRYSGLPLPQGGTTTRATVNLLCFAALRLLHLLAYYTTTPNIQPPLKNAPRWEFDIDRFFVGREDIGNAYVTRVSGLEVMPEGELCIYSPRSLAEQSYRDSNFGRLSEISTAWYGEYFVPQLELLLAILEPDVIVRYDGKVAIRKIVDLQGADLPLRSR